MPLTVIVAGALIAVATPGTAAAQPRSDLSQPNYSYTDAIRETVYVESPVDGDRDGQKDRIVVDVIRPKETAAGLKVPVIFEASPYFAPAALSAQSRDGRYRPDYSGGYKDEEDDGVPSKFKGYYDNYFVPRGYAVVQVDLPGTRFSEGCATVDGKEVMAGVKAALDWLDGRASAVGKSGQAVQADWDSGNVGMIGKSRPGVLANIAATLNVPNLKTIVPIAAFNSWYGYLRLNGLPRFADYPRYSAVSDGWTSKLDPNRCAAVYDEIPAATDERDATYTSWFAERDYRGAAASNLKASVFMVHGLNDYNVTPDLALDAWNSVKSAGVPRKLMLTQMAHVDPINSHRERWLPQLHRWLDHWLLGIENGVMSEPQVQIEHAPNQWDTYAAWPADNATTKKLWLEHETLSETQPSTSGHALFFEKYDEREKDIVASPETDRSTRVAFLGKPLTKEMRVSGVAEVTLSAKASASGTPLSAFLVDYGTDSYPNTSEDDAPFTEGIKPGSGEDCFGAGTTADTGCYPRYVHDLVTRPFEIVSKTTIDTENRNSLLSDSPVVADKYYTYNLKLQPNDYVFKPGHRIGLVIAGTNCTSMEVPGTDWCSHAPEPGNEPWQLTEFEIDLGKSSLTLPVAPR
ncbi:CocE/NonD family hydrolase [Nonomuraea dietziae]|uniref:CocE/NonD family hydrolase n=1 Tax=Nonomuraea dietziae TaxID=65515 RepID=UPI001FE41837